MSNDRTPSLGGQPPQKSREAHLLILKGFIDNDLMVVARRYDATNHLEYFKEKESPHLIWLDKFITRHPSLLKLKEEVSKLVHVKDAVLILGETGTGKELIAHALHGGKPESRFIPINCAGLPEYLIESELFGHVKGSFSGAIKDKEGLFKAASGGTLFLDEIGELGMTLQAKLLRVLQDKRIRAVGSETTEDVDFRLVCATHRNLKEMVIQGKFRQDLYARLRTFELYTLNLAERPEDIPLIVKAEDDKFPVAQVDWQVLLRNGHLCDNVRSLQSIVRRWQVMNELPKV